MKITKTIEKFLLHEEMDRMLEEVDFRKPEKTTYPVGLILLCALVGVTMGANSWNSIAYAAELRSSTLLKYYPNAKKTPSHDTLRRFFSLVSTEVLEKIYRAWAKAFLMEQVKLSASNKPKDSAQENTSSDSSAKKKGIHVAIDGKTNRGAISKKGTTANTKMHILNAFATEFGICLGQRRMEEKTGEITNLPILIKELLIGKGDVVTIDAIGTQVEIAKEIVKKEADYILEVKGNQPKLKETIANNIAEDMAKKRSRNDEAEEWEDTHGRTVRRHCFICTEPLCLGKQGEKWAGVKSYGVIRIERTINSTGEKKQENHYFISSLKSDAKTIMKYKRDHWKVENNLHWMLDVQYKEDDDRKKDNSAQNFALINKMVLAILKLEEMKQTQERKRMRAAADPEYLEKIINLFIKYFAQEE
ncbi:MAG: ISAs1 family transposase [Paludibacteraceae bacterium]